MTRDVLIARLHYYACEDAAQGDVLNDVIAIIQRDGETITALEAERENLMLRISELQAAHDTANRSLATLEQITAELLTEHNLLAAEVEAVRFFVTPDHESKTEAFARLRRMLDDIRNQSVVVLLNGEYGKDM